MRRTMAIALTALLAGGCSLVGIRGGTEQPDHTVVARIGDSVEIRRYEPRLAAQVTVPRADDGEARERAFRILADYIFGANTPGTEIAMTAPVEVDGEGKEIAMTAPVETAEASGEGEGGKLRMRFFLPARWTMDTVPQPVDDRVELVELPARTLAVRRFTGSRDRAAVRRETQALRAALADTNWQPTGEAVAWFYDPPWTIPFLRRNEVALPVARR